jgi:hypothetical protein
MWLNLIPRAEYEVGAGLVKSAFEVGRSEPSSDEETWVTLATTSGGNYIGSCGTTYNQTYVGFKQNDYRPEGFGLRGPLVCQDDLTLHWQSLDFWQKYFMALEKRNVKSITNRLENIYMNYVPKYSHAGGTVTFVAGNVATQPPGSTVDLSGVVDPQCGLTQDVLDQTALQLAEDGADEPDSNGWITNGGSGPVYPLLIGQEASNELLLNNAELREDFRFAYEGMGDANPVIQRLGASRVIKNFRHVVTRFPARWKIVGADMIRVPRFLMSSSSTYATKGQVAIVNPDWQNPNVASVEAALVLSPWVFTEEVLRPVNSAPGMTWTPQNYMGDWRFVTGNDALLGFDDCTGVADPTHKLGRHFAEYRHAAKPIFPDFGRMILFRRCPATSECLSCS